MLDELHTASDLLRVAIDRYLNACLAIKCWPTEGRLLAQPGGLTGSTIAKQLPRLFEYETKLCKSKTTILQSINTYPDVVPISKLSTDILLHVFQELVDMEYRVPSSSAAGKGIPKYPVMFAHICAKWRQIVHQTPSLWSRVRFTTDVRTNKQFLAYMDFHAIRAEQALMDIYISDLSFIRLDRSYDSTVLDPFVGRIRSLEF
ncbi:hypothetical protein B0J17DRAFT_81521 [Rhizoctonia solani]|nr:hypothetical protein B0J17DRAFT_81521 [Rhizoctonia solani]